jgi:choline dehydrogenase-like flavoprotein
LDGIAADLCLGPGQGRFQESDMAIPFVELQALGPAHVHGLAAPELLDQAFDVCVIGSGASGAVAAATFVRAGLRTLVLEEGSRLSPLAANATVDAASPSADAGNDAQGWNARGWPWSTRNLGGGTLFYGGASFRYTDFDFDPTQRIRSDGLNLRWPIGAADLEPYYCEMEQLLAIDRAAFVRQEQPPPTLSLPAEHLWAGARRLGHAPLPTPLAIDRQVCNHCSLCISSQCGRGAKRDVVSALLAPLSAASNLVLLTGVKAVALTQDSLHHVGAVQCLDMETGVTRAVRAGRFVLACNAVQTAALLLRSTSSYAPAGLGNEHDLVGRGLCMKLSEYTQGTLAMRPQDIEAHPIGYRGPFSTVCVLDHYLDERCPTGVGGLIYEAKHDDWRALQAPGLVLRVETILADHPASRNRVRLTSTRDRWGLPRLALDYTADARDLARLEYMVGRSVEWLAASGATAIQREPSNYAQGSTHLHGTCRAGTDPRSSVVDRDGRVHSLDNVNVVDGSYMPYPGGLNPTLTIQANALRIARLIAGATQVAPSQAAAGPSMAAA